MSEVELARRLYKAFAEGDLGAAADLVDPEIELRPPPTSPEERTYKGYDAVRRHLTELIAPFDGVRILPREFIDAGSGKVVVILHVTGRGKSSGFEIDTQFAHVLSLSAGRVTRLQAFLEADDALRAADLEVQRRSVS